MIAFRHADRRWPFLWESTTQPAGRWHDEDDGPVQYLSDTPDGAWAEFLRHEEITDVEDLAGVSRALWAVSVTEPSWVTPDLAESVLTGGVETYPACVAEARRLREAGASAIDAPSAALFPGTAGGFVVDGGMRAAPPADGRSLVLFGTRPEATGWKVVDEGRPPAEVLDHVRHL